MAGATLFPGGRRGKLDEVGEMRRMNYRHTKDACDGLFSVCRRPGSGSGSGTMRVVRRLGGLSRNPMNGGGGGGVGGWFVSQSQLDQQ